MASLRVLAFDHEGRPVAFDTWHVDLQLYLLSDLKDSVSLFDHVSGVAPAPPATADGATHSQWLSRDATARLAIRNHLPVAEYTHFGQHRTNWHSLKNVLWVPNLAANLISVRQLQKASMDTSSKGAKTYTARLGERILWELHEDRDVYNEMWQIPVVPMPKERQVAASISTKGEEFGSGNGANGRAKEIKSKKCNLGGTNKLGEHKESGAAAKKQHKDEENPKAAAEEEYGESMWGTIASAAFSNPTSATGECDWLTDDVVRGTQVARTTREVLT
ncbi:unnamed protein product [Closterium sp. NIES-53]